MVKIGALKVLSAGSKLYREKVVVLPGNEFKPEHFLTDNLDRFERLSPRTWRVKSTVDGSRFIIKRIASETNMKRLTPVSEAKLARMINLLSLHSIRIEEPVAVIVRPKGATEIVFREVIEKENKAPKDRKKETIAAVKQALGPYGVVPFDLEQHNILTAQDGVHHIIDVARWRVPPSLMKKYGLRYAR